MIVAMHCNCNCNCVDVVCWLDFGSCVFRYILTRASCSKGTSYNSVYWPLACELHLPHCTKCYNAPVSASVQTYVVCYVAQMHKAVILTECH